MAAKHKQLRLCRLAGNLRKTRIALSPPAGNGGRHQGDFHARLPELACGLPRCPPVLFFGGCGAKHGQPVQIDSKDATLELDRKIAVRVTKGIQVEIPQGKRNVSVLSNTY